MTAMQQKNAADQQQIAALRQEVSQMSVQRTEVPLGFLSLLHFHDKMMTGLNSYSTAYEMQ